MVHGCEIFLLDLWPCLSRAKWNVSTSSLYIYKLSITQGSWLTRNFGDRSNWWFNIHRIRRFLAFTLSGIWGLLAGPLFRSGGVLGVDPSDGLQMLLWNVIGMGCIIAWNAIISILLFGTLHKVGVLRVKKHVEIMGLDAGKHDEWAYPECKIIIIIT